ncbi:PGPGW domain-containing protein [Aeromicrobium sp.]|nr:PGPGW domain-containing protein [Candidatus Saccharibacteria bacterium]
MSSPKKIIRKVGVGLIGFPLLVVGAILVPLPGPGLLVMFIALVLLSNEFEWAGKYADSIKAKLKAIYAKSMAKAQSLERSADKSED